LTGLLSLEEDWPGEAFTSAEVDLVTKILAEPEFQWVEPEPGPLDNLIDRILNWFADFFDSLSISGGGGGQTSISLQWVYYIISFIIIALLFHFIFRGTLGGFISEAGIQEDLEDETYLTAEKAFSQAKKFSQTGDHRQAVRFLYLSALFYLDEKGVLNYDTSKTNREYVQSVAGQKSVSTSLKKVVEVFDKVWYGFGDIDTDTYTEYEEEVNTLHEQK
jgi:hypothetical protein